MSSNAVIVRKKVTTDDKIRKYYLKGEASVSLSPVQDEIRIKVYKAWNLMINYHSKEQAMSVLVNDGSSRAQAYRYVNSSLAIFGDILKNHKEAKRYLIEEDLMRLQQRAIKDKDGALELKVIAQRIKIGGFDKDTLQNFDPEKLKAQTYVLKVHPSVLKTIEANQDGGSLDFNHLDAEEVDYLDVKEDDDED
ncbi:hypothetical protein ACM55G_14720 [Flavobacterium sp. LB3P122]|uniref:hypothetical protein n=1 Tax=Flavobacterium algoriphilum TaxID=3398738 RepID=UPI003A83D11B